VLAVLCLAFLRARTRVREDAALGLVLSGFFAVGIVLSSIIQRLPGRSPAGLETFIYGQAAAMSRQDVLTLGGVACLALLLVFLFIRPFTALCFDEEFTRASGMRAQLIDFVLMTLISLVTIAGLPAAGVVLIASLLIIPATTARLWTQRLVTMLFIAGAIGLFTSILGVVLSNSLSSIPTGAAITLSGGLLFAISFLAAPRRGLLARAFTRWNLARRIALQNLLRALYELHESGAPSPTLQSLLLKRSWSPDALASILNRARRAGLVTLTDSAVTLTPAGMTDAQHVVRAHRLWELYLIEEAELAQDHVDRDADHIEHVLPPHVIEALEARLRAQGRLPGHHVPSSPHAVPSRSSAEATA
jgi:manganese/zinc/iron transport system permease protein